MLFHEYKNENAEIKKGERTMQETGKEQNQSITVPMGTKFMLFAGILLGMLLLVLGNSLGVEGLRHAGAFILPAALFWGGFYLKEEGLGIRIALLAVAGYLVAAGLLGLSSLASLFGG
jgi:hypothetical protein